MVENRNMAIAYDFDGTLAPGAGATRAQIAAMFQRFCDWMTA